MKDIVQLFSELEPKAIQSKQFAQLDQAYSYSQLTDMVKRLAQLFAENDLKEGDRIILSSKHNLAVGVTFLACLRCGITTVLLDPDVGPNRAAELIKISDPKAFFVDQKLEATWSLPDYDKFIFPIIQQKRKKGKLFKKMLGNKKKDTPKGPLAFQDALENYNPGSLPDQINPSTIAYILFTSGTTSVPKAVQISHQALWANLATINEVYRLDANSRIFNILTTYHTDGIIQGPVLAALNQATWYHPMEFSVDQIPHIFDLVFKYRITHFITVPTMLSFLLKFSEGYEDSFSGEEFQYIVTSASPFELDLWQSFEATFNTEVINNYGLTETVAGASYCGPDAATRKVGTIGKPIDCEFKIIDDEGKELGAGQRGELLIRGLNVLTSYLNNESATEAAFKEDWFCTGDIVERDEEGFYTIVGRKKNIVISGGINIQPEEVSEIINIHPAVQESVCLGEADELFGEKLVACVVPEKGAKVSESEVIAFCRQELEPAKVPTKVFFLETLPKTISGKIQVRTVREMLKSDNFSTASSSSNQFLAGIYAAATDAFKIDEAELSLQSSVENVDGWDSMAHLIFVTNMEKTFNVRFSTKEIMQLNSIQEADVILRNKLN